MAEVDDIRDVHDLALFEDDLFSMLGLDAATVVGHSFGGMLAAELAAHVPHRVAKLVLLAPLGLRHGDFPGWPMSSRLPRRHPEAVVGRPRRRGRATFHRRGNGQRRRVVARVDVGGQVLWPIPDKGLGRRLRRVTAETLVVRGADDRLADVRYAVDFAAAIPGAQPPHVVDGAGHTVLYDRTTEIAELVRSLNTCSR